MTTKRMYAEIAKTEAQDDGTIKVWGYASSGAEDSDGETVTADAMKAAIPDYMKFGAVREMHQASAAGTAIEASVQDDGKTWFGAHVVDPVAVKKVQTGVYKGFSIGGKVTARDDVNKTVIKGLKLIEVSLVDRPANPEALISIFKADRSPEEDVTELAELLDAGTVTPAQVLALVKAAKEAPVVEAVVEAVAEPVVEEVAKAETADEIKKGIWDVSDFAQALYQLGWIVSGSQSEADYEGDNSPIPAQLREWIATGLGIFQAMAAEECAEMIASMKAQAGELGTIEMAAKVGDIEKAGARYSKATKAALADVHKAIKECNDKLSAMGYEAADGDDDDVQQSDATGDLAKVAGELDVAKAALDALTNERDTLSKRVKELEAMPAPGKALLKAITKGQDVQTADLPTVAPVLKSDGTEDAAATLIKAAHASGGFRLIR